MRGCQPARPSNSFFWSGIGKEAQGERLRVLFTGKVDFLNPQRRQGRLKRRLLKKVRLPGATHLELKAVLVPVAVTASPQRCGTAAGRCLTLPAQVPSHPPPPPPPPQGPTRIYCFPWGVQGSVHNRAVSSDGHAPRHGCIPSPSPKAPTSAWGRLGTPRACRPLAPAAPRNSFLESKYGLLLPEGRQHDVF